MISLGWINSLPPLIWRHFQEYNVNHTDKTMSLVKPQSKNKPFHVIRLTGACVLHSISFFSLLWHSLLFEMKLKKNSSSLTDQQTVQLLSQSVNTHLWVEINTIRASVLQFDYKLNAYLISTTLDVYGDASTRLNQFKVLSFPEGLWRNLHDSNINVFDISIF